MAEAIWVYGVQDAAAARPPAGPGVDPAHPVEQVRHAGLAAVASRIDLARFGADALSESLEDLETLGALARAHDRVLGEALGAGALVPFSMCTLYTSLDGVRAMLARERTSLARALERLRGRSEWGVKGFAPATPAPPAAQATTGAEYLARKSAVKRDRNALEAAVAAVHEALAAAADAATLSPLQDPRLAGRTEEMVLNGVYLVADADVFAFRALVADLVARHHVPLEVTGPWPAYHFSR
ncbi:GvpL/GvpF family gas vesicle protein [Solirubrobacter ginsenosidimutans]|uniref:GvpL/GvpF family gas vesicle protein n=1 Tax=Solirubrobacter ginsenosidimutans TaxID=490573 RepID=A0A9X3N6C6_9ACTN|nr:GvpL/GvpF family gas vesicle protein [Solirubrobacter ginsenosidimutans]MDA0165683.1 GvpL/GvpF family gas vesicle protein [Solirubrobacter ginsenosidimutans]